MTNELKTLLAEKNLHTDFCAFYYEKELPMFIPFGKKIYTLRNGKLVALIPIELVYAGAVKCSNGYDNKNGMYSSWYLHCNIAGEGHKLISDSIEWFNSISDYEKFINGDKSRMNKGFGSKMRLSKYLSEYFQTSCSSFSCWYYKMDMYYAKSGETSAEGTDLVIKYLYIDQAGIHISTDYKNHWGNMVYNTREKAIKASAVSEVVDFDDDEPQDEMIEIEVTLSVKATTRDDALKKIEKELDRMF